MNAYGKRIEKLYLEIERYLAFIEIAREDDHLWKEYEAFKKLTQKKQSLQARIAPYSASD